jgi:hypothetical protein
MVNSKNHINVQTGYNGIDMLTKPYRIYELDITYADGMSVPGIICL